AAAAAGRPPLRAGDRRSVGDPTRFRAADGSGRVAREPAGEAIDVVGRLPCELAFALPAPATLRDAELDAPVGHSAAHRHRRLMRPLQRLPVLRDARTTAIDAIAVLMEAHPVVEPQARGASVARRLDGIRD